MYGLLLENLSEYVKTVYGEDKWDDIRRQAGVDSPSFSVHQVYPENLLNKLAKKAQQVLHISEREFMDQMGVYFVSFVGQYGYDRVLSVLGRHMRDFLNGLDNLHEYLKFSYPRMRAPSFICENETKQGLTLHYRSKRRGFVYYTMGQIREVARHFYHKDMHIELVREEILFDTVHVTFQLTFDNRAFTLASLAMTREEKHLPISAHVLFEIFPFCIVFGSDMIVRSIGNSLMVILPELCGKKITAWFDLVRPLIAFKFQTILNRTNNIFELVTVEPVTERFEYDQNNELLLPVDDEPERSLRLKGQMIYMDNWRMIMFLGTPVMPDLTSLITTGLYINDLSMHDFSRDLMLAGTQQSVELKLALDQEQQKSKKLEESMRKLDEEMRRTDELLYQMIPKQVADRLRKGENPIDTCEMFDSVSILFSDVVTFTEICSRITPMEVVSMLNAMYSIFDTLTERNLVYKVETIGDAYMVVAGAPEQDTNHAEKVCDMALDMVDAITDLKDPSTGQHLRIRVGVHSGAVVAGIVGLKMPRYCLFGDSVNTASRMESTSAAMKIHVSESTKEHLGPNYKLTERGEIDVKGKGTMKTYWLDERENRKTLQFIASQLRPITNFSLKKYKSKATAHRSSIINKERIGNNMDTRSATEHVKDITSITITTIGDDRSRIYSPVTFKDVARRSIVNSPVHTLGNTCLPLAQNQKQQEQEKEKCEIQSSTSDQIYAHSLLQSHPPSTLNTLALNTEEFLDDLKIDQECSTSKPSIQNFMCPFSGRPIVDENISTTHCNKTSSDATQSENISSTTTIEKTSHNVKPSSVETNTTENYLPINDTVQNLEGKDQPFTEKNAFTTKTVKENVSIGNASNQPIITHAPAEPISNNSDKIIWTSKQITATFEKDHQSRYNTNAINNQTDIKDELNEVKEVKKDMPTARPLNNSTPESTIYNYEFDYDYDTTANSEGLSRGCTTTAACRSKKLSLTFNRNRRTKKSSSTKEGKIQFCTSGRETSSGSNPKVECLSERQHLSHHYHHHRLNSKACEIL